MLPRVISKTLTAPSANCIAQGQSVAAGAKAILNGTSAVAGAFTLDTQRRIAIVSSGNDSANTAHIYGNRGTGQPINEVLNLTNAGTAVSNLDYLTGGTVTFSGATAGTITVGTNGTGSTNWTVPNYDMTPFSINSPIQATGTVAGNFETTNDRSYWDPPRSAGQTTPQPNVNGFVTGITAAAVVSLVQPVTGYRLTITNGTGTLSAQVTQAGITNM